MCEGERESERERVRVSSSAGEVQLQWEQCVGCWLAGALAACVWAATGECEKGGRNRRGVRRISPGQAIQVQPASPASQCSQRSERQIWNFTLTRPSDRFDQPRRHSALLSRPALRHNTPSAFPSRSNPASHAELGVERDHRPDKIGDVASQMELATLSAAAVAVANE